MKHFNQYFAIVATVIMLAGCKGGGNDKADIILFNAKIATMTKPGNFAAAVAIKDGIIQDTGNSEAIIKAYGGDKTTVVDGGGRTVVPGLNDSHIHIIREGLNYNSELRWDGVKTLKRAMEMLKEQAQRTPEGVWVKVVGGWNEFQFDEKRQPTLAEINAAVPDRPVFISYLYGKAFLNKKGIEVLKYDKNTQYEGSLVELDQNGVPTGMLFAKETPKAIYTTLGLTTKLSHEERLNSTQQFYRELNRFGLTSAVDAAGGGQNYDSDYAVALELAKNGKLNLRTSYYLFAQQKGRELQDYEKWVASAKPGKNDNMLVPNGYSLEGAGENLVATAADFENFLEPRTILSDKMEADLEPVIRLLVKNRWPFRLHATYGESIERMLNVFERVNNETPFNGLRWCFDHAETITPTQLARVKQLGGGIAVQFRMYFQGELYNKMYGAPRTQLPPIKEMLKQGIPVGMGTDATRISTYNPWMALHWLITGQTIGGMQFWPKDQVLDRFTALTLYTTGSAWFSGEEKLKGQIKKGQYADMAILSKDFFSIGTQEVKNIESLLTIVNGKVVYAAGPYAKNDPGALPVIPIWSPIKYYGGYQRQFGNPITSVAKNADTAK
ncbi:amidohydrolase [Pedobacter sp. GSP4]|uniref:amidohydrolase n=1 Tax=Pedobacter sp. GSP4 TaxID=3453716 RepID=UPI003EEFBBC2